MCAPAGASESHKPKTSQYVVPARPHPDQRISATLGPYPLARALARDIGRKGLMPYITRLPLPSISTERSPSPAALHTDWAAS